MSHTITGVAADFNHAVTFTETAPSDGDALNAASIEDNSTTPKTAEQATANAIEYFRVNDLINGIFGDGLDGSQVLDGAATITLYDGTTMVPAAGVYTAARDLFFFDLTINGTGMLQMAGFRLFVADALTMTVASRIVSCDGGYLAGAGGGAAGGAAGILRGSAGAAGGAVGGAGSVSSSLTGSIGLGGGNGGTGGGGAGGNSGSVTSPTAAQGSFRLPAAMQTGLLHGQAGVAVLTGGTGGGGGGGAAAGGASGGGGGGGGVLLVCARSVNFGARVDVALSALGGIGAAAAGGTGAGGGGGGGGGGVLLTYHVNAGSVTPLSVMSVLGGAGGAHSGAGGFDGGTGNNGTKIAVQV